MEIYEKAKELGELISESPEFLKLRRAEEEIMGNPEALKIFNDFESMRQDYVELLHGTDDQDKLEQVKQTLITKNAELTENSITSNYMDSKTKVDTIFKTVTDILLRAVNGGQDEDSEGGCGSGCSSCGGGCR